MLVGVKWVEGGTGEEGRSNLQVQEGAGRQGLEEGDSCTPGDLYGM